VRGCASTVNDLRMDRVHRLKNNRVETEEKVPKNSRDYTNSEDCCYDPSIDDKKFGLLNHFQSLEDSNSCADNKTVLKCMKEHEKHFSFGQKLFKGNKQNTCAYWKTGTKKNYCDNDNSFHNIYKKMLMDCCASTCEFCATSSQVRHV
jgi:hypothetical protein